MRRFNTLAAALMLSMAGTGVAFADSHHGHGGTRTAGNNPGAMGSMSGQSGPMHDMMRMMKQMHGQMMRQGQPGTDRQGSGMHMMMDRTMMRMMKGGDMMATPTPEAVRTKMLARLAEFDEDKDGTLSLSEFEKLHAAMIRETTVDRFQHLDADGDGRITTDEMAAPARRMEMRGRMNDTPQQEDDEETPDN